MSRNPTFKQYGFTIIEIMVAVTLSLILLGGVIQIYLSSRITHRLQAASSNVQENGRFAMEFITKDIRMAGISGCANINKVKITNNVDISKTDDDIDNTVASFTRTNGITGYTYDPTKTFPTQLTAYGLTATNVVKNTDILYLQRAQSCPGGDIVCHNNVDVGGSDKTTCTSGGATKAASYKIADNTQCNIQKNDIIMISNCTNADIHAVTNTPGTSAFATITHANNLNTSSKLSASYGAGSSISKVTASIYYIGKNASGEPALYRRSLENNATVNSLVTTELVEGIYNMSVLYGVDTDDDASPNRYVPSVDVAAAEWPNVVSVRITFSSRSNDTNAIENDSTYKYDNNNVTDRRLRRDFSTTVTIRNRAL